MQRKDATDNVASSELPATQMLLLPTAGDNDNRPAAHDLVLAKSSEELTELEAVLDAIADDLAANGVGNLNDQ